MHLSRHHRKLILGQAHKQSELFSSVWDRKKQHMTQNPVRGNQHNINGKSSQCERPPLPERYQLPTLETWCRTSYSTHLRIKDAHFLTGLCHTFEVLLHTYLNSRNLSSMSPVPWFYIPAFPSPCPVNPVLFPRSLLHLSAKDYSSIYNIITTFRLCLCVAGIMFKSFFPFVRH